jgi:hypothetical protein
VSGLKGCGPCGRRSTAGAARCGSGFAHGRLRPVRWPVRHQAA